MQKYRLKLKLDKKPNQLKAYLNDLFKILKFFKFHIIVVRKKKKSFFIHCTTIKILTLSRKRS